MCLFLPALPIFILPAFSPSLSLSLFLFLFEAVCRAAQPTLRASRAILRHLERSSGSPFAACCRCPIIPRRRIPVPPLSPCHLIIVVKLAGLSPETQPPRVSLLPPPLNVCGSREHRAAAFASQIIAAGVPFDIATLRYRRLAPFNGPAILPARVRVCDVLQALHTSVETPSTCTASNSPYVLVEFGASTRGEFSPERRDR